MIPKNSSNSCPFPQKNLDTKNPFIDPNFNQFRASIKIHLKISISFKIIHVKCASLVSSFQSLFLMIFFTSIKENPFKSLYSFTYFTSNCEHL